MTEGLPSQKASIIISSMSELVLRSTLNFAHADLNGSLLPARSKIFILINGLSWEVHPDDGKTTFFS